MPYPRATQHAARVGQALAILFGVAGFFVSPILLFIAVFVWIGAAAEGAEAQIRSGLEGTPVRAAMVTDFRTLAPDEPLSRATELILAGAQEDFPVLADGRVVGVLTRNALLRALAEAGSTQPVSSAMERSFETADPSEMLSDVLPRMRAGETHTVPVVRDEQLLGLLTPENVSDFLSIQAATRATPRPRPGHAAV
jgi:CBS domain-containing protein